MARFQLSLSPDYVPAWGLWEGLREIIQNGLDSRDSGSPFVCDESENGNGKMDLTFTSQGVKLDRAVWLLGTSSKDGINTRGHFGEGLKLGVLALVRAGYRLSIVNDDETWTPNIEDSDEFKTPVLTVRTRVLPAAKGGFSVKVFDVSVEDWRECRQRVLDFVPPLEFIAVDGNRVLLDRRLQGQLFVKGIWVSELPGYSYGYDLASIKTDRDRKMVDRHNLDYEIASLWNKLVAAQPSYTPSLYGMLLSTAPDMSCATVYNLCEARPHLLKHFFRLHGADAYPVSISSEVQEVDSWGRHPVTVPDDLKRILRSDSSMLPEVIRRGFARSIDNRFPLEALSREERDCLALAQQLLKPGATEMEVLPLLQAAEVVTFKEPRTLGLFTHEKGPEVFIARRCLGSVADCVAILAHELAHAYGGDGSSAHEQVQAKILAHSLLAAHNQQLA